MKIIVREDRTFEIINQATTQNENEIEAKFDAILCGSSPRVWGQCS